MRRIAVKISAVELRRQRFRRGRARYPDGDRLGTFDLGETFEVQHGGAAQSASVR